MPIQEQYLWGVSTDGRGAHIKIFFFKINLKKGSRNRSLNPNIRETIQVGIKHGS